MEVAGALNCITKNFWCTHTHTIPQKFNLDYSIKYEMAGSQSVALLFRHPFFIYRQETKQQLEL